MNEANGLNEVVFTSAAMLDLLLQIDELAGYTIGLTETLDGQLQLQIGDSIYLVQTSDCQTIRVEDEVVGEIEEVTEDAYTEILDCIESECDYPTYDETTDTIVEGSIIKEIAKSLTLGGMIRFATKHLLK